MIRLSVSLLKCLLKRAGKTLLGSTKLARFRIAGTLLPNVFIEVSKKSTRNGNESADDWEIDEAVSGATAKF